MKWQKLSTHKQKCERTVFPYSELLEKVVVLANEQSQDRFLKKFRKKYNSYLDRPSDFFDWCNYHSSDIYERIKDHPKIKRKTHQNKFVDFSIQSYLEKKDHFVERFRTSVGKINVVLEVKSFENHLSTNKTQIARIQEIICRLLRLSKWKGDLTLDIWLTDCKKTFPSSHSIYQKPPCLGSPHVNSGLSSMRHYFQEKYFDCQITIFRKEEIEKVLVHELIHSLYFDFKRYSPKIDSYLMEHLAVDSTKFILLFESYTEFWAVLLYSYFREHKDPGQGEEDLKRISRHIFQVISGNKQWSTDYHINLKHSFNSCANILRFFGFTRAEQILDGSSVLFQQKSGVFSYFIIKTALLYSIKETLDWCVSQQQVDNQVTQEWWIFPNTSPHNDEMIMKFAIFCLQCLRKKSFLGHLNQILNQKCSTKGQGSISLKMTYYGKT